MVQLLQHPNFAIVGVVARPIGTAAGKLKLFDGDGLLGLRLRGEVGDAPPGSIVPEFANDLIVVVRKIWNVTHVRKGTASVDRQFPSLVTSFTEIGLKKTSPRGLRF